MILKWNFQDFWNVMLHGWTSTQLWLLTWLCSVRPQITWTFSKTAMMISDLTFIKCLECKSRTLEVVFTITHFVKRKAHFDLLWHCMSYIHHANSSTWNTAAGVRPLKSIIHSLTLSTVDAIPYFPQQKELQHTITKFDQSFWTVVGGKQNLHTWRRTWPANCT